MTIAQASKKISKTPWKKKRHPVLARGKKNTLRPQPGDDFYGFLSRIEGPPEGPWHLRFECTPREWMESVWREMDASGDADVVREFLGGRPFLEAFAAADAAARDRIAAVWDRFVMRFADAATAPRLWIFEMWWEVGTEELNVDRLSHWFALKLVTVDKAVEPEDVWKGVGVFISTDAEAEERAAALLKIALVPELTEKDEVPQGVLQALHFPHTRSEGTDSDGMESMAVEDGGDDPDGNGRDIDFTMEEELGAGQNRGRAIRHFAAKVAAVLRRFGAWLVDLLTPRPFFWAVSATEGPRWPLLAPAEYHGSPPNGQGGHLVNRMSGVGPGPHQPFVAIYDIGQGCCSAIINREWRAEAYFDFGYSVDPAYAPANQPNLCFCSEPYIILSHWDFDHYRMSLLTDAADGLRWIAPRQLYGGPAVQCIANVSARGGEVWMWDQAPPSYMPFGWGFLERCTGGQTNNSGLAAWVCVRDDPVNPPVGPGAAVAVNGIARIGRMGSARTARHTVEMQRRTQFAGHQVAAEYTAAALGGSRLWAPLTSQRCARAANAAAQAFAGQNPPYQMPQNIVAAIANVIGPNHPQHCAAIANACLAVLNAGATRRQRAAAAAGALNALAVDPAHYAGIIEGAVRDDPPPVVYAGAAPFVAAERYVLLTGDANFSSIPSTALQPPPSVVGVLAMHHGSNLSDGEFLNADRIPFAPGTAAAIAAHDARGGGTLIQVPHAAVGLRFQADITHAARVAVVAVYAAVRQQPIVSPFPAIAAGAAAAVAAAVRAPLDPALVALAATMAFEVPAETLTAGRIVEAAAALLALGGAATDDDLRRHARGAFPAALLANIVATANALAQARPANIGQAFAGLPGAPNAELTFIADSAGTAALAANGQEAAALGFGVRLIGKLNRIIQWPPIFQAVGIGTTAATAATLAAIAVAAHNAGLDPEVVESAVRAASRGRHVGATAVRLQPQARTVCYPYGVSVRNNRGFHAYARHGNFGHPHPLAIAKYEAKGWTVRLNACAAAQHAGVQGSNAPRGHIALGWDVGNDAPLNNQQPIAFACPVCANAFNFQC
ncbi:MAG TPA: hypothetical protein VEO54_20235 [Thermoanaerobaculia bacterium]|nr:hypothetical protein [Thermoanaerobaculia bacterium]